MRVFNALLHQIVMSHAISEQQIEDLAFGKLPTHKSIQVQRHIYECPDCLRRLIEITYIRELQGLGPKPLCLPKTRKLLSFVHDTADGFIYSKVERRGRECLFIGATSLTVCECGPLCGKRMNTWLRRSTKCSRSIAARNGVLHSPRIYWN